MRVYKYMSMSNFIEHIEEYLLGKLFFADWHTLNDPMEGLFLVSNSGQYTEALDGLKNAKYHNKVCALAGDCDNFLLWSHYADSHKGICIGIDVDVAKLKKISYNESLPLIYSIDSLDYNIEKILTSKLNCWSYENEYRILEELDKQQMKEVGKIKELVFGMHNKSKEFFESHPRFKNEGITISAMTSGKLQASVRRMGICRHSKTSGVSP
ncbi:hypothetical protein FACS1894109_12580 [Spirochaetia bacterium]|nr:hypothetical protein FACS1894109_12580 [Spirochaetia bacterium]